LKLKAPDAPTEAPSTMSRPFKVRLKVKISHHSNITYRVNAMNKEHAGEIALRRFKANYPLTWKYQEPKVLWAKEQ